MEHHTQWCAHALPARFLAGIFFGFTPASRSAAGPEASAGADAFRLAQPTAAAVSESPRSNSASLARTASPRWMRTGVRMICPALARELAETPRSVVGLGLRVFVRGVLTALLPVGAHGTPYRFRALEPP